MIVYSRKIIEFIDGIKRIIKNVLSQEVGLQVGRDRFYDRRGRASYPIRIVVFNHKKMLGYFDPSFFELGFHESLMLAGQGQLGQVVRHELAHYLTFIDYPKAAYPHGDEFRDFCRRMGWGEEVSRATLCLEEGQDLYGNKQSDILRKVEKLMALSTSLNRNEAELAMIKSRQLLLKHNIESKYLSRELEGDRFILKRILKQKREDAKMRAIGRILETFFVTAVYHRSSEFIHLEILGDEVNVEIAEYVAGVLQAELEVLWDQARQEGGLKGMVARNSFFSGLAKGYCNKVQALKRDCDCDETNALMVIEKKLSEAKAMAYQRLSTSRSCGGHCQESSALGERMGRQLNINPALNKPAGRSQLLIDYS